LNIALIILSAILTFIASKTMKNLWAFIAFGAILPFVIIVLLGYLLNVAPDAQVEAGGMTDYLGAHLVEWLIADIFGVMIGAVAAALTGRSK